MSRTWTYLKHQMGRRAWCRASVVSRRAQHTAGKEGTDMNYSISFQHGVSIRFTEPHSSDQFVTIQLGGHTANLSFEETDKLYRSEERRVGRECGYRGARLGVRE